MAAYFLVGFLVAGAISVAEGATCADGYTGDCTTLGAGFAINQALSCLAVACEDSECCRPHCTLDQVNCSESKTVDTTHFCDADDAANCNTTACCTITRGKCQIAHCNAVNGSHVLKTDYPKWCESADCSQAECCDSAGVCTEADCTAGNLTVKVLNQYCVGKECIPARECCQTSLSLSQDVVDQLTEGATTLTMDLGPDVQVGDEIIFTSGGTELSKHTITSIKTSAGRRLGANIFGIAPPLPQATADALSGSPGTAGISLPPGGGAPGAVSDPITFYRGYKTKFWLPNDKLTLLLETKDIKLYVSVLEGPSEDLQWFGRFFVFKSDGSKLCDIDVNRDEIRSPDSFEQIVIRLGDSDKPLPAQTQTYGSPDGKVKFGISTMPWNTPGGVNFTQLQELVYFDTDDLSFMILPSHAGNEFPTSKALALKYMHLDFIVSEMKNEQQFGGILPEFWGLKPRSHEARAMLTKPSQSRALSGDDCGTCNGAPFWE